MTNPQDGRSGSQNPSRDASSFKLANGANHSSPTSANALVITTLKRTAESQPTVWEGRTADGHAVHIAYRFGEVTVEVLRPHAKMHGCWGWTTVTRFKPVLIEAEITTGHDGAPQDVYARRLMAEQSILGEIRRSNQADMRRNAAGRQENAVETLLDRDRLVIRDSQLVRWLDMRDANLPRLIQRGLAGGSIPVCIRIK